jgi:hypothetical protein
MMQINRFADGGFVAHKCFGQRISAWFNPSGILLDCARFDKLGRCRRPSKAIVERLVRLGSILRERT